jgi:hypothetical protein
LAGERKHVERREYITDQDRFFNYCLWEYRPLVAPQGKFRSVNLLFHSLEVAGADPRMFDLVQALRRDIGMSQTVWGIKYARQKIGWELYFYDYRRRERALSMSKVLKAIEPLISGCTVRVNENYHYFMFSIDISNELVSGSRSLDEIHMYIGNPGSTVSSGICYSLTGSLARLENFYFFFDAKLHRDEIIAKICCSAHVDTEFIDIDMILWPELRECKTICLANKQQNDCIYFSGINVDQLIFFLCKMKYPVEFCTFVEDNRRRLDHLLYDVGFDYRMIGDSLTIEKSGYYGIF